MISLLENHLWQSTVFAVVAALLSLTLRGCHARVRHAVWLAASIKFLIPFSMLISAGFHLPVPRAAAAAERLSVAATQIGEPFSPPPFHAVPVREKSRSENFLLFAAWFCGFGGVLSFWFVRWRNARKIMRAAVPVEIGFPIPTRVSRASMEPGIFGLFRPVMLLPEGIDQRLTHSQLQAIIAHELSHVRRRDNLAATIHMLVEAVFWFHPLVWWIGARLIAERERACDEEVLSRGNAPEAYAEGILNVCKLYLESPLACASGITSSDLSKRIEEIMTRRILRQLTLGKKLLLAVAASVAITSPIVIGVIHAQTAAPSFEVVSIKPNNSQNPRLLGWQYLPGGTLEIKNIPLSVIIAGAYGLPLFNNGDRLSGAPKWTNEEKFDIDAKAGPGVIPLGMPETDRGRKMALMMQNLLAERFKLAIHRETKEMAVYDLVVAKSGLKLPKAKMAERDCPEVSTREKNCHALSGGQGGGIIGNTVTVGEIVDFLQVWTDRPVIDKTGVTGFYDIDIRQGWVPMRPRPSPPPGREPTAEDLAFADPTRPTLNAVLETVGLKLEPSKGPVEVVVIDHVERPSQN